MYTRTHAHTSASVHITQVWYIHASTVGPTPYTNFMKETDGGEGAFEHLPVMYPLISINYIVLHTGRLSDKTISSRVAAT